MVAKKFLSAKQTVSTRVSVLAVSKSARLIILLLMLLFMLVSPALAEGATVPVYCAGC